MIFQLYVTWADPEIFKRRGRTSKRQKKNAIGSIRDVYDLGARCFLYTYVWYDFFHLQMEVWYVCVGDDFCTRKS